MHCHHDFLCIFKVELFTFIISATVSSHTTHFLNFQEKPRKKMNRTILIKLCQWQKKPSLTFWESCYLKLKNNHMLLCWDLIETKANSHSHFWKLCTRNCSKHFTCINYAISLCPRFLICSIIITSTLQHVCED